jgi:hypothetical protein
MIHVNVMTAKLRQRLHARKWAASNPEKHAECIRAGVAKYRARQPKRSKIRHGMTLGGKQTPEYVAWHDAKQRCTNPNDARHWKDYGGRGIKFLFTSFEQFFAELGSRPEGKTLDRINNDGNYEPGNVRWATQSEQNKNQRRRKQAA